MAPKKKIIPKEISLEHLSLEDVFCIACRCIYLQPVTMPCSHTLCLECFKSMVDLTAYQCPICRMRISNWLRKYKNDWDLLVNKELWKALQLQYPVEVQKRLNDEDDGVEERITSQGFNRVLIPNGEIKKEFDSMLMNFEQQQQQIELQNVELAKQLQEEEEANKMARKAINEQLSQNDSKIAAAIQEDILKEFHQEKDNNVCLALKLQNKVSSKSKFQETTKADTKCKTTPKSLNKKGPLDKIFAKLTPKCSDVQYTNTEHLKITDNFSLCNESNPLQSSIGITASSPANSRNAFTLSPFKSFLSSSKSLFQLPSKSTGLCTESCPSSSITDFDVHENKILNTCSCGRLNENFNNENPPCQFCNEQIKLLDTFSTQIKNDYLIAKELQNKLNKDNFENYNLRKRSASPIETSTRKKIKKLSKGQQTLKQVLTNRTNIF